MSRLKKHFVIFVVLLVAACAVEVVREKIVYGKASAKLERVHQQLKPGMTKDEVRQIAGEPESVLNNELGETWYWSASNYQGVLWQRLGLTTAKGHYTLAVSFDAQKRIEHVFGGIN
ncbi:MAG TPA: outer membrane protein assembly factor BamE [Pyrinomonadaceae bacterium]|jgi:outer membrane protein assembly factor BamE (lipoprotein component of BamABCDE complex)